MQLMKQNIESNLVKAEAVGKLTLDKDFNVPDLKEDMDKVIVVKGTPVMEECECLVDRVKVKGHLHFQVLYMTQNPERPLSFLEGVIPFTESVHMEGVFPTDDCRVQLELEDLNVSLINSRKIIAKALLGYKIHVYGDDHAEITTELSNASGFECLYKKLTYSKKVVDKKDMFRVKQEVELPQAKPNIGELIWYSVNVDSLDTKLSEQEILLNGDLSLFVIYQGDEVGQPLQYLSMDLPFSGALDLPEAASDMVSVMNTKLSEVEVFIRPDLDGEERKLEVAVSMDLDIQVYDDTEVLLLEDVFAPNVELTEQTVDFAYESILMKNAAKTRVSERIRLNNTQDKMMQICQVEGSVKIDDELVTDDGLQIEGVVLATIIYISANDAHPVCSMEAMVPFSYLVEMEHLSEDDRYEICPQLLQLSAIMIDGDEVELKAQVDLNIVAFARGTMKGIESIETAPLSYDKIKALPAMAGYVVKDGDTLWSIAKRYYTTIDGIRKVNQLESDKLMPGQKLLVVKES